NPFACTRVPAKLFEPPQRIPSRARKQAKGPPQTPKGPKNRRTEQPKNPDRRERPLTLSPPARHNREVNCMKTLLIVLSAAALASAGDSNRYREDFHYSYPQTAGGRLTLENFNGSVEITGWEQNTVDISGTKYAESQALLSQMRIEASSAGNAV